MRRERWELTIWSLITIAQATGDEADDKLCLQRNAWKQLPLLRALAITSTRYYGSEDTLCVPKLTFASVVLLS